MSTYTELELAFARADVAKPLDKRFGSWTPAQRDAFKVWDSRSNKRLLLFQPTGKGKTKVSLAMAKAADFGRVIVVAPPKTKSEWDLDAKTAGLNIIFMSHEKFRMAATKLPRDVPIIVDEFHKLGKHDGVGFKKLARMAQRFPGIILCSATPNYNDSERVYCVGYILEPEKYMGGYLNWIMNNCITRTNPFAITPYVDGFQNYEDAADFLSSQPWCAYLEDTAKWIPFELEIKIPAEDVEADLADFDELGLSWRKDKIIASEMEARWARKRLLLLTETQQYLRPQIAKQLVDYLDKQIHPRKFLIFCMDKTIANAVAASLEMADWSSSLITGDTTTRTPEELQRFLSAETKAVLTGTAALATGVNGIDRATNHLIIFDDTDDNTLRRQLIGRVLPRGEYVRDTIVTTVATSV